MRSRSLVWSFDYAIRGIVHALRTQRNMRIHIAAAAIGYSVGSAKAMILGLFVAGMVAESRVEAEIHTIPQAVSGAVLGFLLATAAFQLFWR